MLLFCDRKKYSFSYIPLFLTNIADNIRLNYSIQYIQLQPILVKNDVKDTIMEQKIRRDLNMGDNLRRLRNNAGLSQEKLCAELQRRGCDIGRTTYAKYEAGELNIRASVIVALREIYNCSFDDFFLNLK